MRMPARLEKPVLDECRIRVSFVLLYEVAILCLQGVDSQVCRLEQREAF